MPREMTFKISRKEYKAVPVKVDRRKLYGWSQLRAVDDNQDECRLLTTDESGRYIIPLGGTGMGIMSDDGLWAERSWLKTVTPDGKPAKLFESSYSTVNKLTKKLKPEEFLDYNITDFYELRDSSSELLKAVGDDIFTFQYTYNDSYSPSPAFVMAAEDALYLLIGVKNVYEWLCFGDCDTIDDDHDDRIIEEADQDIDFSMF